jgi:hypothetical protein
MLNAYFHTPLHTPPLRLFNFHPTISQIAFPFHSLRPLINVIPSEGLNSSANSTESRDLVFTGCFRDRHTPPTKNATRKRRALFIILLAVYSIR